MVCLKFSSRRCRCGFLRNDPIRFVGQRIFLLLDQAHPVVHSASSASVKLEATLEIGKLFGIAPPQSSKNTAFSIQINRKQCVVENDCV